MPLPVSLSGLATTANVVGPFKSSTGNVYLIGKDSTTANVVRVLKATDPTTSFSSLAATKTASDLHATTTGIGQISAVQQGDLIHVVVAGVYATTSTNVSVQYLGTFDMSTDTWSGNTTVVHNAFISTGGTGALQFRVKIRRKSTGVLVVYYNGPQITPSMDSVRARVNAKESSDSGATWGASYVADGSATTSVSDYRLIDVNLDSTNRAHILLRYAAAGLGVYRSVTLSSANVASAISTHGTTAQSNAAVAAARATVSTASSTERFVISGMLSDESIWAASYGTVADSPTYTAVANVTITTSLTEGPVEVFTDNNTDVYSVYGKSDGDLYYRKSTDGGVTYGAETSMMVAAIASGDNNISRDSAPYVRGSNWVHAYAVNDAGTWKYNEFILRAAAADTTGTLAATESGADTAAIVGVVADPVTGTLAATESGADTAAIVAAVTSQGTFSASETGADTASILAAVAYTGTLVATEAGADTAAVLAQITITGSLAATEAGSDAVVIVGTIPVDITGTLAATESGADTVAIVAGVTSQGTLAATETGADIAAILGTVKVSGTLVATETGADTVVITGLAGRIGTLAATESGADTASISGLAGRIGSLAATEAGADTAAIIAATGVSGTLLATETGSDVVVITSGMVGSLAATEAGSDTLAITGLAGRIGSLAATEAGNDTLVVTGLAGRIGTLAATESGNGTAVITGTVAAPPITGTLAATETGVDRADIKGPAPDRRSKRHPSDRGLSWLAQQAIAANQRRDKESKEPADYSKPLPVEEPSPPLLEPPSATIIPFPGVALPLQVRETAVDLNAAPFVEEDEDEEALAMLMASLL